MLPMAGDMEPVYNKVLSVKGDIFEACTMSGPPLKKIILEGLECSFNCRGTGCNENSLEDNPQGGKDCSSLGGRGCLGPLDRLGDWKNP